MKEYLSDIQEVLKAQGTTEKGLTTAEAKVRLEKNGPNKLAEGKKTPLIAAPILMACIVLYAI